MTQAAPISINSLCLPPGTPAEHATTVARIGAVGIGPFLPQVIAFGIDQSARAYRDSGLHVATLTHLAFGYARPEIAKAERERLMRTIEIAAQLDAETITFTTGGRRTLDWPAAAERFVEAIAPCAERARQVGVKLSLEPTSHLYADVSIAHRLSDTVALVRAAGIHVGIDVFACWVDSDLEAALAAAAPMAALVQLSDYVLGDRGLPCRAVPGDGAIPLDHMIHAIHDGGFRGWYDLEIIGPRLAGEGVEAGLRRAIDYVARLIPS